MTFETLEKANMLKDKIEACQKALNCFHYTQDEDSNKISLNPHIAIEFDGEDREMYYLPGSLNEILTIVLESHFITIQYEALQELKAL